jgi:serine/threonine protein phosphatase PrpC
MIVIASDGIWDSYDPERVVQLLEKKLDTGKSSTTTSSLILQDLKPIDPIESAIEYLFDESIDRKL